MQIILYMIIVGVIILTSKFQTSTITNIFKWMEMEIKSFQRCNLNAFYKNKEKSE